MKPSEFYEKYWKIDNGKGEMVSPPKLSEAEKAFLDEAVNTRNTTMAVFMRRRRSQVHINVDILRTAIKNYDKLPPYFMPVNQPKLDKWGNILENNSDK